MGEGRSMYLVFILSYVLAAVTGTGIFAWVRKRRIIRERSGKTKDKTKA